MDIEQSIELLNNGGTLLYPTDTIWGLGCDATNELACQKIIELKQRPENKSFILLVDGFQMLEKYVPDFHPVCYDLADLATEPLTIIYPTSIHLAPSVLADDGSVGIRITKDVNCLKLIRGLRKPLVSTSANISGEKVPESYRDLNSHLLKKVDGILELRQTEKLIRPSQIIKIGLDGSVKVIRS
jgi:L-threonylcarbamoyladenylate synthase